MSLREGWIQPSLTFLRHEPLNYQPCKHGATSSLETQNKQINPAVPGYSTRALPGQGQGYGEQEMVFYSISNLVFLAEKNPQADQAIARLIQLVESYAGSEGGYVDVTANTDGTQQTVALQLPTTYLSNTEIERLDEAIKACSEYAAEPIVVEYSYDDDPGVEVFAKDPVQERIARAEHEAREAARRIREAGAPLKGRQLEKALAALVRMSSTGCRSLIMGRYTDTYQLALFPLPGTPEEAEAAMIAYLADLEAGEPARKDMPGSASFEILDTLGVDELLEHIALLGNAEANQKTG